MHLGTPQDESTTTPPIWTLPDKKSSGEGRRIAKRQREAAGARDEVEGSNNNRKTSYGVDEGDDEEGQDIEEMPNEEEEG
ncbi:hypothetical protein PAXINDRAFT_11293 [Paxillus involutus ATCC 200175]|uniref:Uncharacterized protein n=1 Tax=Paxillus involutus ATCC 200175 TaxID=664439 RepID=A0A0C9TZB3_PAXIN|nr:hypothetical protein PAXINDRAFT_11293 [Paxillus involutus ATCC 200175]